VLVSASVKNGATGIDSMQVLQFEFSEALNARTATPNITIFPLGRHDASIRVRGRRIRITPESPWKKDVVYTLILGKNISDLRNNSMTSPIQISFTREEKMPRNQIRGRIHGLKQRDAATIHISRVDSHPDSILASPEYFTQSDASGDFYFDYLPRDHFYLAAYIDLNKSNTYNRLSDGVCVPSKPGIKADSTELHPLDMLAVYDHFMPLRLLRARNIYPGQTELEFTKEPAVWNRNNVFLIEQLPPDTVIYDQKKCILYHRAVLSDSLSLSITGLKDHINCTLEDTLVRIPVSTMKDTLYAFEQKNNILFITPRPDASVLQGIFMSATDTSALSLSRLNHGIYKIPFVPVAVRGQWKVNIPLSVSYPHMFVDSSYTVPIQLSARPEHGAVVGRLDKAVPETVRLVLESSTQHYEIAPAGSDFLFPEVLPGNYTLSWYSDRNGNERPDPGRPFPFDAPEIVFLLETNIQVRARWDMELEDTYKIDIEKQ
jgi:hypothetical protein